MELQYSGTHSASYERNVKETIHGTWGLLIARLCTTRALILILAAAVQSPIKEGKVKRAVETRRTAATTTKKTVAADLNAEAAPPPRQSPPSPP